MTSINGLGGGGLDIEGLVAQYRSIEILPRSRLETKRYSLEDRKQALTELDSSLSALYRQADKLLDIVTDVFATRQGESSNSDLFTVAAQSSAQVGSHSLEINRLASIDTRVSEQYDASGSDFGSISTDQTFKILVAHPTDADPNNRVEVSVTVSAATFAKTNDEVLADITSAINDAMSAALTAGDILSAERVTATTVSEEAGTSRLVLRSGQSGEANSIEFDDVDGLLGELKVSANKQAIGGGGGYITPTNQLSAEFVLDGLTFERDSNSVDDALPGLTIQLRGTTTVPEAITVTVDVAAVKGELQSFMDAYNESVEFLRDKTQAGEPFRGDTAYSTLRFDLRSIIGSRVGGVSTTSYDQLWEVGIGIQRDGTLYFEDTAKFETVLTTNGDLIADIFREESQGVAVQLKEHILNYTRASGIISGSVRSVESFLRLHEKRLDNFDERLQNKEDRFRDSLIRLQTGLARMQQQQYFFSLFAAQL